METSTPCQPNPDTVKIGLSPKWHKILLRLQQLERQGAEVSIIRFTRRGPRVLEVSKVED